MLYTNFMGNAYETGRVLLAVMSIVLLALPTLSPRLSVSARRRAPQEGSLREFSTLHLFFLASR